MAGLTAYWHHSRDQSPHKITQWSNLFPTTSLNRLHCSWTAYRLEVKKWCMRIYIFIYIYTHTKNNGSLKALHWKEAERQNSCTCYVPDLILKTKMITNHNQKHRQGCIHIIDISSLLSLSCTQYWPPLPAVDVQYYTLTQPMGTSGLAILCTAINNAI